MNYLIVEDDPNLRLLWRSVLGDLGGKVTEAASIEEAEAALAAGTFDVMVLDLYLGRENGMSLAVTVERDHPGCRVIVVTGAAGVRSSELRAKAASIVSVHRKPVDIEDLIEACQSLETPTMRAAQT